MDLKKKFIRTIFLVPLKAIIIIATIIIAMMLRMIAAMKGKIKRTTMETIMPQIALKSINSMDNIMSDETNNNVNSYLQTSTRPSILRKLAFRLAPLRVTYEVKKKPTHNTMIKSQ